jgi:hypothetical protein
VSLVLVVVALGAPAAIRAQATCDFALGFAALRDLLPQEVGRCLEDQRATPAGDAEQRTTGGLLAWRKADNWTAFTDGNRTWVNGPQGLQARLNVERFPWESDAAGFPAPAVASAPAGAAGPAGAPVLAWYYPQFSQDLRSDVQDAAGARIDALIVSETGATDLAPYLQAVRGTTLRVVAGVEPRYGSPEELRQRLRGVLDAYGADPGYLQYQGKPVIVFWNLPAVPRGPGQSPQQSWGAIRAGVDPGRRSVWIGEGGDTNPATGTLTYLPAFDGLHLYSIAWAADPKGQTATWAARVRGADPSKLWVATVMPGGYYGSGSDRSQWQQRDRAAGAYYRATWDGAVATQPAMVIITSYNETNERTEIARSPEWGTRFLDLTRQAIDAWRG